MKRIHYFLIGLILFSVIAFPLSAGGTPEQAAEPGTESTESTKSTETSTTTEETAVNPEALKLVKEMGMFVFEQNQKYEDFELTYMDGTKANISDFKGKVFLLNFWATWCGPCRSEMPSMQNLYDEFKDKGFDIAAVNLREDAGDVAEFMKENELNFPILMDQTGEVGGFYGAQSIPTTYVFDRNGNAVTGVVGSIEWDTPEIKKLIELLVSEG